MARAEDRSFTLEDVRRSYTEDKAWAEMSGDLPAYLLYRPLSFYLTLPLLKLGVSPLTVTLCSGLLALTLPLWAVWGGPQAYLGVGLSALGFHVLDCVDGNLARARGQTSLLGGVLDGAVDLTFWASLLSALGVLASREAHPWSHHAGVLAAFAVGLVFLQRAIRDLLVVQAGERAEQSEHRPVRLSFFDKLQIGFGGLEHLYAVGILAAGPFRGLTSLLLAVVAYALVIFVFAVVLTLRKARQLDRVRNQTR